MVDHHAEGITLFVHSFFPEGSEEEGMLKEAASILEDRGIKGQYCMDESFLSSDRARRGDYLLAFVPSVEGTGQMALKAGERGLSGIAVYGDSALGIHLEEGNVIAFFGEKGFHSEMIKTEDAAFPKISEDRMKGMKKDPLAERILGTLYTSLMIYGMKGDRGFLSAADEARHLWKERKVSP